MHHSGSDLNNRNAVSERKKTDFATEVSIMDDLKTLTGKTIVADIFHAPSLGEIEHIPRAAITLDDSGVITSISTTPPPSAVYLPPGHYLLPGLVDLHVHAPQFAQLGTALDVPLEEWLQKHTFPLEARFSDVCFARSVYTDLVQHLLECGTTSTAYYATVHVPATKLLAEIALAAGQRALIGKVAMDHPDTCPEGYRDASFAEAVEGTRAVVDFIRSMPGNTQARVRPTVTPRFIPACTDECLQQLGELAREEGLQVQTHVSESDWEHAHVLARKGVRDAQALDAFGLLQEGSVLAHGNFLSVDDMRLVRERQACVAHCAWSNVYFSDAVFPLREAIAEGVRVGLGTDISGGPIASIWDAGRFTIAASRMREAGVDASREREERGTPGARVDFRTVFHLMTRGGARAARLPVGAFQKGLHFDAVAVNVHARAGQICVRDGDAPETVIEKIVNGATKANVAAVWTDGVMRSST